MTAKILVSTRNLRESKTAMMAGASIIDIKEPNHGPLGRSSTQIWQEVSRYCFGKTCLSAALGEWQQWHDRPESEVRRELSELKNFSYAKVGPENSADQLELWRDTIHKMMCLAPENLSWIAVVYADTQGHTSLKKYEILKHSLSLGLDGILIDTFGKTRPWQWNESWKTFCREVRKSNLKLAIAGGMTLKRIRRIGLESADWFAVRGSVCAGNNRMGEVSFRKVRKLCWEMRP